jgi:hypothetical protein
MRLLEDDLEGPLTFQCAMRIGLDPALVDFERALASALLSVRDLSQEVEVF